jgi:hypothetical protein
MLTGGLPFSVRRSQFGVHRSDWSSKFGVWGSEFSILFCILRPVVGCTQVLRVYRALRARLSPS